MIELDERLRSELDLLVPLPAATDASWEDALRRAAESPLRRKRLTPLRALALAAAALAVLAVSPVGGAIARSVGDFSAWLTGTPGEPASEAEQRAFERERSWTTFPDGPELRRLIVTEAAGSRLQLFGFRTGDSLCLRLTVEGLRPGAPATSCVPLRELRQADAPAVVVLVDVTFGRQDVPPNEDGHVPPQASASFGVVADGVRAVELETNEDVLPAIVSSNAFLAVASNPPLGTRAKALTVELTDGERVPVELAEAPFGNYFPETRPGTAPGPTELERRLDGGTIGWLERREPRGRSLAEAGFEGWGLPLGVGRQSEVRFARVVRPDPVGHARVAIGLVDVRRDPAWVAPRPTGEHVCWVLQMIPGVQLGACSPVATLFASGPVSNSLSGGPGGAQYLVLHGLTSDDVARLEVFHATGERLAVPLTDNAYVAEVARTKFPIRVVAYDEDGRVVAVQVFEDHLTRPGPRPVEGQQRVVTRVTGPNGHVGTLRTGPSTEGTVCWRVDITGGGETGGCQPKEHAGPAVVLNVSRSGIVSGNLSPEVATVELHFRNGERAVTEPVDGVVLHALTAAQLAAGGLALAVGFAEDGDEVGRQRFERLPR